MLNIIDNLRDRTRWFRRSLSDPRKFVKTDEVSGQIQFELLKKSGCTPGSYVLDVGCGCLHAGVPLMGFLEAGHYAGIDPNEWLRDKAMKKPGVAELVASKQPAFLSNEEFDASQLGMKFDFIFAHSVLSHAAHWQLDQFLSNSAAVLSPDGKILASIRLAEGNEFGSTGSDDRQDSKAQEWQYPGISWFKLDTVRAVADKFGLTAEYLPEYTRFYTDTRPHEFHDWMLFTRK